MSKIWYWFTKHFDFRYIFTPFAIVRTVYHGLDGVRGYADVYVFGVRIARIQETKPWE